MSVWNFFWILTNYGNNLFINLSIKPYKKYTLLDYHFKEVKKRCITQVKLVSIVTEFSCEVI